MRRSVGAREGLCVLGGLGAVSAFGVLSAFGAFFEVRVQDLVELVVPLLEAGAGGRLDLDVVPARCGVCTVTVNRLPKRGNSVSTAAISSQRNSQSWSSRWSRTPPRPRGSRPGGRRPRTPAPRRRLPPRCRRRRRPAPGPPPPRARRRPPAPAGSGAASSARGRLGDGAAGVPASAVSSGSGTRARQAGDVRRVQPGAFQGLLARTYALLHSGQYGAPSCVRCKPPPHRYTNPGARRRPSQEQADHRRDREPGHRQHRFRGPSTSSACRAR